MSNEKRYKKNGEEILEAKPSWRWEKQKRKKFETTKHVKHIGPTKLKHTLSYSSIMESKISRSIPHFLLSLCALCPHYTLFRRSSFCRCVSLFFFHCAFLSPISLVCHNINLSKHRFNSCVSKWNRSFLYPSMIVLSINRMINLQVNRLKSQAEHSIFEPIQSLTINA